jgi:hypothetical protein
MMRGRDQMVPGRWRGEDERRFDEDDERDWRRSSGYDRDTSSYAGGGTGGRGEWSPGQDQNRMRTQRTGGYGGGYQNEDWRYGYGSVSGNPNYGGQYGGGSYGAPRGQFSERYG